MDISVVTTVVGVGLLVAALLVWRARRAKRKRYLEEYEANRSAADPD